MNLSYDNIKKSVEAKGYKFFTGHYNINLIGIRTSNLITNLFDDLFLIVYEDNGSKIVELYDDFTTDPGNYYSKYKLLNSEGVAILKPGQHKGMWKIGKHRGKYEAGTQSAKVTVYRDKNKDTSIDVDVDDTGRFGINLHHAYDADTIGKYSAGCQVFQDPKDLKRALKVMKASALLYGDSFTYTLLEKKDICN